MLENFCLAYGYATLRFYRDFANRSVMDWQKFHDRSQRLGLSFEALTTKKMAKNFSNQIRSRMKYQFARANNTNSEKSGHGPLTSNATLKTWLRNFFFFRFPLFLFLITSCSSEAGEEQREETRRVR